MTGQPFTDFFIALTIPCQVGSDRDSTATKSLLSQVRDSHKRIIAPPPWAARRQPGQDGHLSIRLDLQDRDILSGHGLAFDDNAGLPLSLTGPFFSRRPADDIDILLQIVKHHGEQAE